jgi:hypothetical protein
LRQIHNIEAVTICVGYDDFLQETVKWNLPLFEDWVIVTEPWDEKTREVCRRFNLRCVLSEDGKRHAQNMSEWTKFNKGRLIERGLQHLSGHGWRLHIDADIALPTIRFRHSLDGAELHEDHIYGIDRILVKSWDDWQKLAASGYMTGGNHDYMCRVTFPKGFEIGTRWAHPVMGYAPVGFFQLWHSSQDEWRGVRVKPYPLNHSTACRTDIQHSLQFDRSKRAIIPEIVGVHLESEPAPKGANWGGRKTKLFGPKKGKGPEICGS